MVSIEDIKEQIKRYDHLKSILLECDNSDSFYKKVINREIEICEYKISSMYEQMGYNMQESSIEPITR